MSSTIPIGTSAHVKKVDSINLIISVVFILLISTHWSVNKPFFNQSWNSNTLIECRNSIIRMPQIGLHMFCEQMRTFILAQIILNVPLGSSFFARSGVMKGRWGKLNAGRIQ